MKDYSSKLIFEKSKKGKVGFSLPDLDCPEINIKSVVNPTLLRENNLDLPEVSEPEVIRHFTNLSTKNHHIDKGFYPLGSCTMKYNPKVNDMIAGFDNLKNIHPLQNPSTAQGCLEIMYNLQRILNSITGMDSTTVQPSAGSQGEFAGILVINKYHEQKGNNKKTIIIPESAHGTNPASVVLGGYEPVKVRTDSRGRVDIDDLMEKVNEETAGMMLTQPNTLGLFEDKIEKISEIIHNVDGLMYMDGANLNALMGIVRPSDMGFDITHINLHKTFSTPHGGGGPGAGPICVVKKLSEFLPIPRIIKNKNTFELCYNHNNSIGQLHGFYGNFLVLVRAYCYILSLGDSGLERMSKIAILNANYLKKKLQKKYDVPYSEGSMHEFVISAVKQKNRGVKALDIAKSLLDYDYHSPTIYFPINVQEAIMIEPTESESLQTLNEFADCMIEIDKNIDENPDIILNSPSCTPVGRLNETKANRELDINYYNKTEK
jgi:glycine dehydrogenase subunit 2